MPEYKMLNTKDLDIWRRGRLQNRGSQRRNSTSVPEGRLEGQGYGRDGYDSQ